MSRLAPPKRDPAVSSDEEVLDDVPIDEFAAATLRLAASPSPGPPLEADRAVSEEAVPVPVARAASIYTPDGGQPPGLTVPPPAGSADSSPASSGRWEAGQLSWRRGLLQLIFP